MTEVQRVSGPHETGHRYVPRSVRPRYMDVRPSGRASFAAPVSQRSEPVTNVRSNLVKHEVAPAASVHKHVTPVDVISAKPAAVRTKVKPAMPRQKPSLVLRRQISDRAAKYRKKSHEQRNRTLMAFSFGGIAATVIMSGIFIVYTVTHRTDPQVLADRSYIPNTGGVGSTNITAQSASEQSVTQADVNAYLVEPGNPRLLRIKKLSVQARIYPVEKSLSGDILPTNNIYDVSWLASAAKPGDTGAALLAGFASGATKDGTFANLETLTVGDTIEVERGDGTVLTFKVVGSQRFDSDKVDMNVATTTALPGKPGLNLLSNTGRYDVRTNKFEQRVLIFSVME